jgi:alpha-D-ribose 1-methylphosphonate 5-triphosphate synthase subunit PhnH
MHRETQYDETLHSQSDFRVLLDSMARPGKINRFEDRGLTSPAGLHRGSATVALALLDSEVSYHCAGFKSDASEYIRLSTGSLPAAASEADFLFLAHGDLPETLAAAKTGLPTYPEFGATAVIQIDRLSEEPFDAATALHLQGPGVDGQLTLYTSGLNAVTLGTIQELNLEFPLGVDVILCTAEGDIVSMPRSLRIEWRVS